MYASSNADFCRSIQPCYFHGIISPFHMISKVDLRKILKMILHNDVVEALQDNDVMDALTFL